MDEAGALLSKFGDGSRIQANRYGLPPTVGGGAPTPKMDVTYGKVSGPQPVISAPGVRTGQWGGDGHQSTMQHDVTSDAGPGYMGRSVSMSHSGRDSGPA